MKHIVLVVTICVRAILAQVLIPMATPTVTPPPSPTLTEEEEAIAQTYLDKFNLRFDSDSEKQVAMMNLYLAYELVQDCNRMYEEGLSNFMLDVYPFNVLTPKEIQARRTGSLVRDWSSITTLRKRRSIPQTSAKDSCPDFPTSKNWTADGVVSPPQDQGNCNSCYIFSSVSALESAVSIKYNSTIDKLSEQQLLNCVRNPNQASSSGGCHSGRPEWVWNTTKICSGAVAASSYYPYTATDTGGCNKTLPKAPNTVVDHWIVNPYGKEESLKCALFQYGPHHISMDFSGNISSYKSGIYDDPYSNCDSAIISGKMVKPYTHALTLVGYGSELNNDGVMTDYWLVKNSYGPDWGMNGYIKVARNKNNLCHIATDAIVPILTADTTDQESTTSSSINISIGAADPNPPKTTTITTEDTITATSTLATTNESSRKTKCRSKCRPHKAVIQS